jgi:hypothetical protein
MNVHPKNNKEGKFDMTSEQHLETLRISIEDDSEDQYSRVGIGKDDVGLFLVDLAETGMRYREKHYCKAGMTLKKVLNLGVELNIFRKGGYHGYEYRTDKEAGNYNTFFAEVVGLT